MKYLKYMKHCAFLLVLLGLWSCADEPNAFETFDQVQKGAFARELANDGGVYAITDVANSEFNITVEYFGENNAADVAAHEWLVWFRRAGEADGTDKVLFNRTERGSFGTNAKSGLPEMSYSFKMTEALDKLGLDAASLNAGDQIFFDGVIVMANGAKFGPDNTGGNVQGGAGFDGAFRFTKSLTCPLMDEQFVGTYSLSYDTTGAGGVSPLGGGPLFGESEVELVLVDATKRSINVTYIPSAGIGQDAVDLEIEFVCTQVDMPTGQGSGLACAGGSITFGGPSDIAARGSFDFTDDSQFTVTIVEDESDGCGSGSFMHTMIFTKQ